MKRYIIVSMLLLLLTSCVDSIPIASYWWIKNMTDDTLNISYKSMLGSSNYMIEHTVEPGDSISFYPGLSLGFASKLPDQETMFADIFGVDSIYVCDVSKELLVILDRKSRHRIYRRDSWSFYQPVGTCYNYVWVYRLENVDLN